MADTADFPFGEDSAATEADLRRIFDCMSEDEHAYFVKDLLGAIGELVQTDSPRGVKAVLNAWWRTCLVREGGSVSQALIEADAIEADLRAGRRTGSTAEDLIRKLRSA